jgi:hypothetical protein
LHQSQTLVQQVAPYDMSDLRNPKLIWLKGWLFLLGGVLSFVAIVLEVPEWRVAALLVLCIWCFARFYYFCFYVIEHYVDPEYHFTGLMDFLKYALFRKKT